MGSNPTRAILEPPGGVAQPGRALALSGERPRCIATFNPAGPVRVLGGFAFVAHPPNAGWGRRRLRLPGAPFDRISLAEGDITKFEADAIVNAANTRCSAAAGWTARSTARRARDPRGVPPLGGCATGEAKSRPAASFPASHVIHTVGPVWHGGGARRRRAARVLPPRSLALAAEPGCRTRRVPGDLDRRLRLSDRPRSAASRSARPHANSNGSPKSSG